MVSAQHTHRCLSLNALRSSWIVLTLLAVASLGCDLPNQPANKNNPGVAQPNPATNTQDRSPAIKTARLSPSGRNRTVGDDGQAQDEKQAIDKVMQRLREYAQSQDTLVVWVFDLTADSATITAGTRAALQTWYEDPAKLPAKLQSALVTYTDKTNFVLDEPVSQAEELLTSLEQAIASDDETANTMQACLDTLSHYEPSTNNSNRLVVTVVVTGQAGSDWEQADKVATLSSDLATPIFVIGYPAPFGRRQIGADTAMRGEPTAVVQLGPETPQPEFLPFRPRNTQGYLLDSGFGPWGLERISRAASGTFLAIRPATSRFSIGSAFDARWPSDQAIRFEPTKMARYTPSYVSLDQYRQRYEDNLAMKKLLEAIERYPYVPVLNSPILQFSAANEAQMKQDLDIAQQPAALLSQQVNAVYELLNEGEDARDDIASPRWQAAYDLALGQALATVVRVDGYNAMLAQLKTGKTFSDPESDIWVLERADSIDTSSLMRSKLERAVELLQGVVDEHPGTPWAYLAEMELQTPIGYVWTELDAD